MSTSDEAQAQGWDAIDSALDAIYGTEEPMHWGTVLPLILGGNDPLPGVSAYRSHFGGTPHWHYVTYGFSELFEKESDDPEVSGYGFELTCRVVDPEAGDEPPVWVVAMLQNLARYVFRTGNAFAAGHNLSLNGPMALERETQLTAAAFVEDPQLAPIVTPNGRVAFLQLVGLTQDEYDAIREWNAAKFMAALRDHLPGLVSDLARSSALQSHAFADVVRVGTERDGSSMGQTFVKDCAVEVTPTGFVLTIGAIAVVNLHNFVRGRLRHGREAWFVGGEADVRLVAGTSGGRLTDHGAEIALDADDQAAALAVQALRGDYPLPSGAGLIRVVPTQIWSGDGSAVERVIG